MEPKPKTNVKIVNISTDKCLVISADVTNTGRKMIRRDFEKFGNIYESIHGTIDIFVNETYDLNEVVEYLKLRTKELDEITLENKS